MAKLPWFPFYPQDWMTDPDVLELTGDQMAAFLWLLCLQWREGQLPYEAHRAVPMVPRAIDDKAVVYVLLKFFPPDPDTNDRRNPRLEVIRQEQEAKQEANRTRTSKARAARHSSVTTSVTETESESETETEKTVSQRNPMLPEQEVCAVANKALRENPRMKAEGEVRPLLASRATQQVKDWLAEGIPLDVVKGAVERVCQSFVPTPESPRIGSFKYFDPAVRKAYKQSQALSDSQQADKVMAEVIAQMQQDYERGQG